jgi:hypothetical protein
LTFWVGISAPATLAANFSSRIAISSGTGLLPVSQAVTVAMSHSIAARVPVFQPTRGSRERGRGLSSLRTRSRLMSFALH